jgi:hypothetical protein
MDARTPPLEETAVAEMAASDAGEKLNAYGLARQRRERRRRIVRGAIGIAALLAIWQTMSIAYDLQLILPPPFAVARTIFDTLTLNTDRWLYGPNIYEHLASSFVRAISGFAIASALAIPLGLLVGRSRTVREYIDPVIRSLYPIPGIAWIPLAILWFGLGNAAVVFVVCIAEFFPLYFNAEAGARNINPILVDRRQGVHASAPRHPARLDPLHHHRHAHCARGRMTHDRCRRDAGLAIGHRFPADGVALSVPRHRSDDGDDPDQRGRLRDRTASSAPPI